MNFALLSYCLFEKDNLTLQFLDGSLIVDHTLTDAEVRVLGSLIEKEITTPDYYPLSLNALVAACNQSSNRNPVVHFDDDTVARAADSLREKKLVHLVDRSESRVSKYRHVLYEAMNLGRPAIAVMCVLMLRGPQTVGEIRTRSNRLYDFSSLEEVETTLNSLMSGEPPLVARLPRQSGEKEVEDLKKQFEQFRKQFE